VPTAFMSYSWDTDPHKAWVKKLGTGLIGMGINVLLDQWDVPLGGDLGQFMATGIAASDRVLMICTDNYNTKANTGTTGGVPYEKMIVNAGLIAQVDTAKFIPIIRGQAAAATIPTFMGARRYLDFRDEGNYDATLEELARDIYGLSSKPALGANPFGVP
jgi:hypothetical protein